MVIEPNFQPFPPMGNVLTPTKSDKDSAGIDFYSASTVTIPAKGKEIVSLGVSWNPEIVYQEGEHPVNIWLNIRSRSGMAFNKGLELTTAGVIDQGYTGEIKTIIYNTNNYEVKITLGDKIAQGIIEAIPVVSGVPTLSERKRGANGFGSSDDFEKENKEPKRLATKLKMSEITLGLLSQGYSEKEIGIAFLQEGNRILEPELVQTLSEEFAIALDKKMEKKISEF